MMKQFERPRQEQARATLSAGVDPALEGDLWTSFHALFVPEIIRLLNPLLLPRYIALAQKYQVMDSPDEIAIGPDTTYPDVGIAPTGDSAPSPKAGGAITATIELDTVVAQPYPHLCIDIRDARNRRLITAIEFMSPANKRGQGRRKYLRKRQRLLHSSAHLLEIDLLRSGRRVPMVQPLPAAAYYVFLSRADRRPKTQIWAIQAGERLPPVVVPLQQGDDDVPLDLQVAYSNAYELGGFAALAEK
jgi:hypothetical protein